MDRGALWSAVHGVATSQTRLSDFTFTFHFHALEEEMATHSSVLAWRIPGTGEPGGLPRRLAGSPSPLPWLSAPGGVGGGAASGGASGLELTRPPQRLPGSGYLRRLRPGGSGRGSRAGRGRDWTLPSSRGRAWNEEEWAEKGFEGSRRVGRRSISPS